MPKLRKPISALDRDIRATCKVLESIANGYPRGSVEYLAIRDAADAFIFLRLHEGLQKSYDAYRRSCTKPLPRPTRQVLKKAGVTL